MESLQPIFQCPICWEQMKDPKVLGCFHSMCSLCVQQYVVTNEYDREIPCPTCRQVTAIPEPGGASGAAKLPANSYLASLIDVASQAFTAPIADSPSLSGNEETAQPSGEGDADVPAKCHRHPSEIVQLYCASCSSPICIQCVVTSCKQHELKSAASAAGEARDYLTRLASKAGRPAQPPGDGDADVPAKCRRHPSEAVQLYCASCGCLICVRCVVNLCKHHVHTSVANAAGEARGTLTRLASKAEAFIGNVARAGADARMHRVEILEQKEAFLRSLEQRKLDVDAALRSAYDEAVELVELRTASWDAASADFDQRVSQSESQCQLLLVELNDLISHQSDMTVVISISDAEKRLNELFTSVRLEEASCASHKFAPLTGGNEHVVSMRKLFQVAVMEDKETTLKQLSRPEAHSVAADSAFSSSMAAIATGTVGREAAAYQPVPLIAANGGHSAFSTPAQSAAAVAMWVPVDIINGGGRSGGGRNGGGRNGGGKNGGGRSQARPQVGSPSSSAVHYSNSGLSAERPRSSSYSTRASGNPVPPYYAQRLQQQSALSGGGVGLEFCLATECKQPSRRDGKSQRPKVLSELT